MPIPKKPLLTVWLIRLAALVRPGNPRANAGPNLFI